MEEQNKILKELASEQFKLLRFINKIMFETTKHQMTLGKEEQNLELLDLAWSTNDCISDNPKQLKAIEELKELGVHITR